MGLASNLREMVGKFLEGAGQSLRVNVTSNVDSSRTQSPNNKLTKKSGGRKSAEKTVIKAKEGDVDASSTNKGVQIDSVHIDTINLIVNQSPQSNFTMDDLPSGMQLLAQAFENKEISFVTAVEQQTLSEALNFEKKPTIAALLEYFKPRLSPRHLNLMRTGLYIRHLNETDPAKVRAEWQKIQSNTDRVERRIINLASAGYFENYFEPLAQSYDEEEDGIEHFKDEFEQIIDSPHFVVFVSAEMTPGGLVREVIIKARKNIKFRVRDEFIYVHAMGGASIATVQTAVEDLREIYQRVEEMPIDDKIKNPAVRYKVYYREPLDKEFYT